MGAEFYNPAGADGRAGEKGGAAGVVARAERPTMRCCRPCVFGKLHDSPPL